MSLPLLAAVAVAGCGGGGRSSDAAFRKLDDVRLRNQIVGLRVAYVKTPAGRARLERMVRRYATQVEADKKLWGNAKTARMLNGLAATLAGVCGDCSNVLNEAAARARSG